MGCKNNQKLERRDGSYTLDDLSDITERIRVVRENEQRAAEAARE